MKNFTLLAVCLTLFLAMTAQAQEEIIIEMIGESTPVTANTPTLWNRTAPQLTRQWRGKTREQVLYAMPVVSDKDRFVRNSQAEYALVEYYNNGAFRKFLFQAETPQTFVAVAASVADVLAINKKYDINIGLKQADFETFYAGKAQPIEQDILPENTLLYSLSYTDINTPKARPIWLLFENGNLTKTFYTQNTKNEFIQQLHQQKEAAQAKAQAQAAQITDNNQPRQTNSPRKALLSGGTAYDQAYMPRVINPNPFLMQQTTSQSK